jgi:hypothetical protein
MKKTALPSRKRAALKASDFAVPSERKYPINDLFHARLALTYVLSPSNAAYRDEVVRAVLARYPELQFWWASRSRDVAAKRARKVTSRGASGRRMVANPMPMRVLSRAGRSVAVFDTSSGFTVATKKGDEDYVPVFRTGDYPAAVQYAEQYLNEFVSNPRRAQPRGRFEQMDYRKKLRLPAHSPEELFGSLEAGIRAVKPHEDKSNRDIARALGLDAYDPLTLATLENLRDGLYTSNPRRKKPPTRRNGDEEWMDEDELAREKEQKSRRAFFRTLGPNVGSSAAWHDPAYQVDGDLFLVDSEDGTLDIVRRGQWNARDEVYEDDTLARFDTADEAAAYLKSRGLRNNPRRKLPKHGEGIGIIARARRGLGTKYRTMREGMLAEGGDVMRLPHRLPGHEGKSMTDLSEWGREWDYAYNDAKPILDLLAASKTLKLRTSTITAKLKAQGMSVDEIFESLDFLSSKGLIDRADGVISLHQKTNPRRKGGAKSHNIAALEARAIARGKREILEDIKSGRVPPTVRTFAELHDYVDANMYGGLADASSPLMGLSLHDERASMRRVQDALDAWLRTGRRAGGKHKVVSSNPRPMKRAVRGGRTAAQGNAAKAMRLFHSGQASSLAEAWAMLRRR